MVVFVSKRWRPLDLGILKGSSFLVGAIVGAYASDWIREHLIVLALAAVLLAIRPAIAYFRAEADSPGTKA